MGGNDGVAIVPTLCMMASVASLFQAAAAVDSIHRLATAGFDSALSSYVAERPDEAREALRQLLIRSTGPISAADRLTHLGAAKRVAAAFAVAWEDSFLVNQVAWFRTRAPHEQRTWAQADSIHREGIEAAYRDGPQVAIHHWRESLRLRASLHDSAGVAASLASIGGGLYLAGVLDSASVYLERARRVAETVGDHRIAGNAVVNLGSILYARGDLRRATERYEEAHTIHRGIGDARGMAADYNNLGLIAEDLEDLEAARDAYEAALALNRKHEHSSAAAQSIVDSTSPSTKRSCCTTWDSSTSGVATTPVPPGSCPTHATSTRGWGRQRKQSQQEERWPMCTRRRVISRPQCGHCTRPRPSRDRTRWRRRSAPALPSAVPTSRCGSTDWPTPSGTTRWQID
jgi:tetratricopeptide (TPR) repeat protein